MSPNFRQPEKAFEISLTQLQAWDVIDSDSDSDSDIEERLVPAPADSSSSEYFDSSYSDSDIEDNLASVPELVESIHNLTLPVNETLNLIAVNVFDEKPLLQKFAQLNNETPT